MEQFLQNVLIGVRQWVNGKIETVFDQQFIETTVSELRDMRDNGELTPGCKYRITDYECKVEGAMSSIYAKSEKNKYDIVVEAINEHTLSQDAKAMNHVPEEPEHEVTEITKFKFLSDMGESEGESMYGFMIRNKSIDGTNTSTDEKMADCQVGWSIIAECDESQFDSGSTFDDVTSWTPYIPNMIKIFTLNSDIEYGQTAYMDASGIGDQGIIEFSILDTLEETHTEGGDYFKNCNLDAWELKYSLDLDDNRFEWVSTKNGIAVLIGGPIYILSRDETYDIYSKWVVNIPIEGTSYQFAYNGKGGEEESGITYYLYGLLGEVEQLPEGYTDVIKFTTEFPVVGNTGYFVMSDESLQPFTFTSEMVSTKNTAWTTNMYGVTIGALTEESPQVGDLCNPFLASDSGIEFMPGQIPISENKDSSNYKGVVYYMKDEWNNECPYDFKNIKFGRNPFDNSNYPDLCYGNENNKFNFLYKGEFDSEYVDYFYTFTLKDLATGNWHDATVAASIGLKEGISSMIICRDNKIKPICVIEGEPLNVQCLNGNVFFNVFEDLSNVSTVSEESLACNCFNNTIEGMEASLGTFGAMAAGNKVSGGEFIFGNNARNNVKAFSINSEDKDLYYGNDTQNILPPSTNIFTNFWKGTQEEYDAMGSHDSNTLYIITEG